MVVLYCGFGKWEKTNSHGFKLKEMAPKGLKNHLSWMAVSYLKLKIFGVCICNMYVKMQKMC